MSKFYYYQTKNVLTFTHIFAKLSNKFNEMHGTNNWFDFGHMILEDLKYKMRIHILWTEFISYNNFCQQIGNSSLIYNNGFHTMKPRRVKLAHELKKVTEIPAWPRMLVHMFVWAIRYGIIQFVHQIIN